VTFKLYISGSQSFSNPERKSMGWESLFFLRVKASSGSERPNPKISSSERAFATSKSPCP